MKSSIRFVLNGRSVTLETDDDRMLLWVLRTDLALTGTKYGCGEGICGACTVTVGGKAVRSCQTSLKKIAGKEVVTIEGLARDGKLHPLQQAFIDHGALQCGYCTSGMRRTEPHGQLRRVIQGRANRERRGDQKTVLRGVADFRVMGRSPQRLDAVEKVTGAASFYDFPNARIRLRQAERGSGWRAATMPGPVSRRWPR